MTAFDPKRSFRIRLHERHDKYRQPLARFAWRELGQGSAGGGGHDGDGKANVFWKNDLTLCGIAYVWLMNGICISSAASAVSVADPNWQVRSTK